MFIHRSKSLKRSKSPEHEFLIAILSKNDNERGQKILERNQCSNLVFIDVESII